MRYEAGVKKHFQEKSNQDNRNYSVIGNTAYHGSISRLRCNTAVEALYVLAINDKTSLLKMCKRCRNAYYDFNSRSEFCLAKCRNQ
jgi:hypothetical protein